MQYSYIIRHSDGTIVSGDSLGTVKFWDPLTSTQSYSFQAHGADVLCMAIGQVRLFQESLTHIETS